jgi:uncharacterized protein (TIRG00374 family)
MNRTLRKTLLLLLALAVVAALLYRSRRAIGLEGFSWERFLEAVKGARLDLLLLSLVAIYVCYFLRGVRWCRFTRYLGLSNIWRVFGATLMGFAAIFLLGRAGEPVRPLLIARREKLPVVPMFGTYVVERVFDMTSTIVFAGLSLVFLPALMLERPAGAPSAAGGSFLSILQKAGLVLLAGLVVMIVFLVYLRVTEGGGVARALAGWRDQPGWRGRVADIFAGFLEGLHAIRTWGDLAVAILLTAAHWAIVVVIYHWVPLAFGGRFAELDLRASVLILACTMLGSTLQLPGVGGGSQLGSFLAMTQFLGVGSELAAAAAVMLWLVTFTGCSLAGVPLLLHEGMSYGELRRIAEERGTETAPGRGIPS